MKSILIITYGREKELFETLNCLNKYKKDDLEILILDNNETNILEEKIKKIFIENNKIILKYFNDGKNYGVALGRNYLIERAKGEILVTLDDDIEIEEDINDFMEKVEEYFNNKNIGCLAFNIINFYSKHHLRHEIPHGNKKLNFEENLYTYYFIGAGHAIKKEVYEKVGLYPNDLGKYGGEERDLSFRILEQGYDILYTANLRIYHKVSENGRLKEETYNRYRNQLIVLNRYMPLKYRITSNIIWSLYYLLKRKIKLKHIINIFCEVYKMEKKVISGETLIKIKKMKGRIFF